MSAQTCFDLQEPYQLRAEDVGWPPKKSDKTTNAEPKSSKILVGDFGNFVPMAIAA
jgi:hypothetical protein